MSLLPSFFGGSSRSRTRAETRNRLVAALAATVCMACGGDETFTPDECEALPTYNIRNASLTRGAVAREGTVAVGRRRGDPPPLSGVEQRQLQKLAQRGCVTLPGTGRSLTESANSDERGAGVVEDGGAE